MFMEAAVEIQPVAPLLMHRYAGEQPSEEKPPRGKKTQEWIDKLRLKKWTSAAYHDGTGFFIPAEMLEAALVKGARQSRKGEDAKAFLCVVEDRIPLYGPNGKGTWRLMEGELSSFYVPEHIDIRPVVIGKARVDACRPIFRQWMLRFTIRFDTERWTAKEVQAALGHPMVAIGDFRPRFGRFKITKFEVASAVKAA